MWWRSRYVQYLEAENERLRSEVERATLERQAAVNCLLGHIGAPTMDLHHEKKEVPAQRKRELPSIARRAKEYLSRVAANTERLKEKQIQ